MLRIAAAAAAAAVTAAAAAADTAAAAAASDPEVRLASRSDRALFVVGGCEAYSRDVASWFRSMDC